MNIIDIGIKQMAKEIFEERKIIQKRKDEEKLTSIEPYVRKILNIFSLSNGEKDSTELVWGLQFVWNYKESDRWASIDISLQPTTLRDDYRNASTWNSNLKTIKNAIDNLKIPFDVLYEITEYFIENLSEYFTINFVKETEEIYQYVDIRLKK